MFIEPSLHRLEEKYIRERCLYLRALMDRFGHEVLEEAAKAKERAIVQSIKRHIAEKGFSGRLGEILEWSNAEDIPGYRGAEYEILEETSHSCKVRVTRCRYAEIYRAAGEPEIGKAMTCDLDPAIAAAFDPRIVFTRTKTLMEGHEYCDHSYQRAEG